MIKVIYDGNLGNNLFQYVFGRLLAERFDLTLDAEPIAGFPYTADIVTGKVYEGDPIVLRGQKPDLNMVEKSPGRPILLTGYFQRAEYYQPRRDKIRRWLTMDIDCGFNPGPQDLVVGIRRGRDYIPDHGIPMTYYQQAIEEIPHDRLYICSDSPDDPFVKDVASRYDGTVRQPGALDNLQFISRFSQMVIANSSFLWWAAFLSDADPIIFPRPAAGFWSVDDPVSRNIALEPVDSRYRFRDCEPYVSEHAIEIARIWYEALVRRVKGTLRPLLWFRKPKEKGPYQFQEED